MSVIILLVLSTIVPGLIVITNLFFHSIACDKILYKSGWTFVWRILLIFLFFWGLTIGGVYCSQRCSSQCTPECFYPINESLNDILRVVADTFKAISDKKVESSENVFYFAWVILVNTVVFSGLLISVIVGWNDRRVGKYKNGLARYKQRHLNGRLVSWLDGNFCKRNQYAVVIGANEIASSVLKQLLEKHDNQYVILQTSSDVDSVRKILRSHLTEEEYDKVIIYSALRDSLEEISALHLAQASEIYILGENTAREFGETYHDAMNMRCLNLAAHVLKKEGITPDNKKKCHIMFDYQTTYSVFQHSDISDEVKEVVDFMPFNRYESWARRVLVDNIASDLVDRENSTKKSKNNSKSLKYTYMPLDGYDGIKPDDEKHVHLVIVGMSKMGIALGIQAMQLSHYPNILKYPNQCTRITFIDANADSEMQFFMGRFATLFELMRYRYLDANNCQKEWLNSKDECADKSSSQGYKWINPILQTDYKWSHLTSEGQNFIDIEVEFIKGELQSAGVCDYLRDVSLDPQAKLTIAICQLYTHEAIAASLYMPREIYASKQLQQIWVYQREASDIISNLIGRQNNQSDIYEKLRPFGMLYGEYMDDESHLEKAQLVAAVYNGQKDISKETIVAQKTDWDNAPVANKWSSQLSADSIYVKMRSVYDPEDYLQYLKQQDIHTNVENVIVNYFQEKFNNKFEKELAVCEHNRWNVEKLLMGFVPCNREQFEDFKQLVKRGIVLNEDYKWCDFALEEEFEKAVKQLKRKKIHLAICDMDQNKKPLRLVDPIVLKYDTMINNSMPKIVLFIDKNTNKLLKDMYDIYNSQSC